MSVTVIVTVLSFLSLLIASDHKRPETNTVFGGSMSPLRGCGKELRQLRGKVASYVIIHRHGERAPTRNIFESIHPSHASAFHFSPYKSESELWQSLLPSDETIGQLQERYPVIRSPSLALQNDLKSKPFGCITKKGLENLQQVGENTKRVFPKLNALSRLKVFSTNYERTQVSAQAFLKGMEAPQGTTVEVLPGEQCPLSFYEHDPDLAVRLTKQVQSSPAFKEEESDFIQGYGQTLLTALPELGTIKDMFTFNAPVKDKEDGKFMKSTLDKSIRINWMAALDYFSCRNAHDLPLHPDVEMLGITMRDYVGSRYKLYYTDDDLRRMAVLPILKNVVLQQFSKALGEDNQELPSAIIYSGHDVNLMGILVALNASPVQGKLSHWPDYGSSIIFELVVDESFSKESAKVNIYYNHEPMSLRLDDFHINSSCIDLKSLEAHCNIL